MTVISLSSFLDDYEDLENSNGNFIFFAFLYFLRLWPLQHLIYIDCKFSDQWSDFIYLEKRYNVLFLILILLKCEKIREFLASSAEEGSSEDGSDEEDGNEKEKDKEQTAWVINSAIPKFLVPW